MKSTGWIEAAINAKSAPDRRDNILFCNRDCSIDAKRRSPHRGESDCASLKSLSGNPGCALRSIIKDAYSICKNVRWHPPRDAANARWRTLHDAGDAMVYSRLMDQIVSKHSNFESADPNSVIVTLYSCARGYTRGWYVGPPSFDPCVPMGWQTSPDDNILAPVALVRAMEIAQALKLRLSLVDPDDLWDEIHGAAGDQAG